MQAYKDGIRSNQLGWHLLVSVLQLGRHITINDLLGDFHLLFFFPILHRLLHPDCSCLLILTSIFVSRKDKPLPGMPAWGWVDALKREELWVLFSQWSPLSAGLPGSCTSPHLQSLMGQAGSRNWGGVGLPTTTCTHSHFSFSQPKGPREKIQHFSAILALRGGAQSLIRGLRCLYSSVNP